MSRSLIVIACILLIAMPITHYKAYKHGRRTLYSEIVSRNAFVKDGKIMAIIQPERSLCEICHTQGVSDG